MLREGCRKRKNRGTTIGSSVRIGLQTGGRWALGEEAKPKGAGMIQSDHEEYKREGRQRMGVRISTRTSWPMPQRGHRWAGVPVSEASNSAVSLGSGSKPMTSVARSGRRQASLARRWQLARKPPKRMRWKPSGSVWSKKRRMNSSAETVMT